MSRLHPTFFEKSTLGAILCRRADASIRMHYAFSEVHALPNQVRSQRRRREGGPRRAAGREIHRSRGAREFALAVKKEQRRVAHDLWPLGEVRERGAVDACQPDAGFGLGCRILECRLHSAAFTGPDRMEQCQNRNIVTAEETEMPRSGRDHHPGDPRWAAATRFDNKKAPRSLTSAACLARSTDRARLCLNQIRI